MSISIDDLKLGNIYRWVPTDVRSWVPFYVVDLNRALVRPKAGQIMMYLGQENTGSLDAYIFLVGDQKFAVYNEDMIYGLRSVQTYLKNCL